jgi:hypothetical protein
MALGRRYVVEEAGLADARMFALKRREAASCGRGATKGEAGGKLPSEGRSEQGRGAEKAARGHLRWNGCRSVNYMPKCA